MKRWTALPGLLLLSLAACKTTGVIVTGGGGQGDTPASEQSEVSLNVSNIVGAKQIITATYNDGTGNDATILYTNTTRKILKGASLFGWSYSTDGGVSWTYGGKVLPPAGWSVLWGDPAITRSHLDQRYVFLSNLAMPDSKFPAGGISGTVGAANMGGACIARSQDGGVTFQNYQCISNNNHFYDGGHMAAGTGGEIYAAYWDTVTKQIDIWKSPDQNGVFALMPAPFPGFGIVTHARIRVDVSSGDLYVAAERSNGFVIANRFHNNAWQSPVTASAFVVPVFPTLQLSDRKLRTGPQFSFDVGAESVLGNDAVRFVYTVQDDATKRFYVRGTFCPRDLSACFDAPEWGTTPGNLSLTGDQFNPIVRAFPGFIGLEPLWKLSYETRQNDPKGNQVAIYQGNLAVIGNGVRIMLPFPLIDNQLVCGDNRGYWGDYDDMQLRGFTDQLSPIFIRSFTDSRQGCQKQWEFTSHHVHVSSATVQ
jgi:hypothetical protein